MSDTEKFETPATPATTDSQGMKYLESTPRRLVTVYLPLAVFLFVLLFPFYWMTITAFKPNEELLSREGNPFWVINPTLAHIKKLLFDTAYPDWLWNTILVSVVSTLLSLFCSVLAAYAIERLRFRGSRYVGMSIFLAYLVPPSILFIPLAAIIFKFQLFDTRLALILTYPTFLIPFCTWLLMGYFRSIPFELEECALIDGASRLQILVKIILPLAVPGLISAGIFAFTLSWNEFIYALTFVSSSEVKTVPVGVITELVEGDVYHWGALMAGALVRLLAGGDPVLVLRRALRLGNDGRGQGVTLPSAARSVREHDDRRAARYGDRPPLCPDATATYCRPCCCQVTTPPASGPPVLKRYNGLPLRASSTRKSPSRLPVNSTPPAVAVTAAYIGDGVLSRHAILPLFGSTALTQPLQRSVESFEPQPLARPVYGTVASQVGSLPSLNTVHQSIELI